jgi:hypothetical protein
VAKNFRRQNEPFCRTLSKRLQLITREGQGGSGGHGRGKGLLGRTGMPAESAEVRADHAYRCANEKGRRASREDQRRIGDILQRVYDEVLRQGVSDRFKKRAHRGIIVFSRVPRRSGRRSHSGPCVGPYETGRIWSEGHQGDGVTFYRLKPDPAETGKEQGIYSSE